MAYCEWRERISEGVLENDRRSLGEMAGAHLGGLEIDVIIPDLEDYSNQIGERHVISRFSPMNRNQ